MADFASDPDAASGINHAAILKERKFCLTRLAKTGKLRVKENVHFV
jgi:hypothetical protein